MSDQDRRAFVTAYLAAGGNPANVQDWLDMLEPKETD
jgi:hypothetical protein